MSRQQEQSNPDPDQSGEYSAELLEELSEILAQFAEKNDSREVAGSQPVIQNQSVMSAYIGHQIDMTFSPSRRDYSDDGLLKYYRVRGELVAADSAAFLIKDPREEVANYTDSGHSSGRKWVLKEGLYAYLWNRQELQQIQILNKLSANSIAQTPANLAHLEVEDAARRARDKFINRYDYRSLISEWRISASQSGVAIHGVSNFAGGEIHTIEQLVPGRDHWSYKRGKGDEVRGDLATILDSLLHEVARRR